MKSVASIRQSARPSRLFVITGGPGSGKTTLVRALQDAGHVCLPEAGRMVIQEEVAAGGRALPWVDRTAFAARMIEKDVASYRRALSVGGRVFFDRGIPDVAGYLRLSGLPVPPAVDRAARTNRYNRRVFIAPPWREIFRQDAERKQDFEEAARTHDVMAQTYKQYGYELCALPLTPVADRIAFVLAKSAEAFDSAAGVEQ